MMIWTILVEGHLKTISNKYYLYLACGFKDVQRVCAKLGYIPISSFREYWRLMMDGRYRIIPKAHIGTKNELNFIVSYKKKFISSKCQSVLHLRRGSMFCRASSGSKLLAKVIKSLQTLPLAGRLLKKSPGLWGAHLSTKSHYMYFRRFLMIFL